MGTNAISDELFGLLPLQPGDHLYFASDLSRLALVYHAAGQKLDPHEFLLTLETRKGNGHIFIPAFKNAYAPGEIFDPAITKPESGKLSLVAWKSGRYQRTSDPFHSFFVHGPEAGDIAQLKPSSTFGKDSVFDWLYHHKGVLCLFDIGLNEGFTFAHYVEESCGVNYRKFVPHNISLPGNISQAVQFYTRKKGYENTLGNLEPLLKGTAMQVITWKGITIRWIDLAAAFRIISEEIRLHGGKKIVSFHTMEYMKKLIKSLGAG